MLTGTCLCLLLGDAHPQLWDGRFQLSRFGMIAEDFSFRGCKHQHVGFSRVSSCWKDFKFLTNFFSMKQMNLQKGVLSQLLSRLIYLTHLQFVMGLLMA